MKKIILIVLVIIGGVFYFSTKPEVMITHENNKDVSSDVQMTATVDEKSEVTTQTTSSPVSATNQNTSVETPAPKTYEVNITNFAYGPKALIINKGDTVVWTNNDSVRHNVMGKEYKTLKSDLLGKGETYTFTFNEIGVFDYYCGPHPMMKASITVK